MIVRRFVQTRQPAILYNEALEIYRRLHSRLGEANCIRDLADVHFSSEEYEAAQQKYNEALIIYQQISNPRGETECLEGLEKVRQKMAEG
jgi:tetratricopeptide (TPR) repeat protein